MGHAAGVYRKWGVGGGREGSNSPITVAWVEGAEGRVGRERSQINPEKPRGKASNRGRKECVGATWSPPFLPRVPYMSGL